MAVSKPLPRRKNLPPLENGARLDQKTFHARYQAMPAHARAELIGGIVYFRNDMLNAQTEPRNALGRPAVTAAITGRPGHALAQAARHTRLAGH